MKKQVEKIPVPLGFQKSHHFASGLTPEQLMKCEWDDEVTVTQYFIPSNAVAKDFVRQTSDEKRKQEFDDLIKQWVSDIKHKSLESQQVNHPAFLRIIALGEKFLPFVFKEFAVRPFMGWLKALPAIVGEDIAINAKSFPEAVGLWVEWGKDNGYLDK